MKLNPKKDLRDLARFNQIILILTKHGFGHILDKFKIKKPKRIVLKKAHPQRLRKAFEELGPTFVKLGQILSLRPDLVPIEYVKELSSLQDRVPPFSYEKVERIIQFYRRTIWLSKSMKKNVPAAGTASLTARKVLSNSLMEKQDLSVTCSATGLVPA